MNLHLGSDILELERFQKSFQKYPQKFKRDIFNAEELKNKNIQHLAGIFAAKEAVIKALDLQPGAWKNIEIKYKSSGKPQFFLKSSKEQSPIISQDISISHDGGYIIAVVVAIS